MDKPDLSGARVFVEADRPRDGECWYVLPDDTTVVFQRRPGEFEASLIEAAKLTTSATWREVRSLLTHPANPQS